MNSLKQIAGVVSLVLVVGLSICVAVLAKREPSGAIVDPEKRLQENLSEVSALKARIESQHEEIAMLRQKLNLLSDGMEELQAADTELRTIVKGDEILTVTNLNEPEVQEKIEKVIEDVIERKQEEREQERRQEGQRWFEERSQRRLDQLAAELELTDYQKGELKKIWDEESQRRRELWATIRERRDNSLEGEWDWDNIQEQFGQLRTESNQKMQQILYPDQYEKYLKIQEENDRGRFGWGGIGRRQGQDRGRNE